MGHYCKVCGRVRANERFSGKGHRQHICKACAALPKEELVAQEQEQEITGLLRQSHISKKNIRRLNRLSRSEHPLIAELASLVLEVARLSPYKKRRLKVLAKCHPSLLRKLQETGLIFDYY